MFQKIIVPRAVPVVTPEQVAAFGRFDCPQSSPVSVDYLLLQTMIEAATDQIESMAATACITETIQENYDFFPGTQDPRNMLNYQLGYAYEWMVWWWLGLWTMDSIELLRRPVQSSISPLVAPVVTYNDENGVSQVLNSSNYTVNNSKITINAGGVDSNTASHWPMTDRRQDCVQIVYQAGYGDSPSDVPAQLRLAIMFLAAHFWENRSIVSTEPTTEIAYTLKAMLRQFMSYRVPR